MMRKICCFAGHSKISYGEDVRIELIKTLENLIIKEDVREFWVGNYGSFDSFCASTVRELKQKYNDLELNIVIPYLVSEINNNKEFYYKNYDNILMADIPENTPRKFYISKCNEYMIDNSQFLVCFVKFDWGGAYKTFKYAFNKKHIKTINLTEI